MSRIDTTAPISEVSGGCTLSSISTDEPVSLTHQPQCLDRIRRRVENSAVMSIGAVAVTHLDAIEGDAANKCEIRANG